MAASRGRGASPAPILAVSFEGRGGGEESSADDGAVGGGRAGVGGTGSDDAKDKCVAFGVGGRGAGFGRGAEGGIAKAERSCASSYDSNRSSDTVLTPSSAESCGLQWGLCMLQRQVRRRICVGLAPWALCAGQQCAMLHWFHCHLNSTVATEPGRPRMRDATSSSAMWELMVTPSMERIRSPVGRAAYVYVRPECKIRSWGVKGGGGGRRAAWWRVLGSVGWRVRQCCTSRRRMKGKKACVKLEALGLITFERLAGERGKGGEGQGEWLGVLITFTGRECERGGPPVLDSLQHAPRLPRVVGPVQDAPYANQASPPRLDRWLVSGCGLREGGGVR